MYPPPSFNNYPFITNLTDSFIAYSSESNLRSKKAKRGFCLPHIFEWIMDWRGTWYGLYKGIPQVSMRAQRSSFSWGFLPSDPEALWGQRDRVQDGDDGGGEGSAQPRRGQTCSAPCRQWPGPPALPNGFLFPTSEWVLWWPQPTIPEECCSRELFIWNEGSLV